MARESASRIGSGVIPYTYNILDPTDGGSFTGGEGIRGGANVTLINPENLTSVDKFAVSGITAVPTAAPIEIFSFGSSPLPHVRGIRVQNTSASNPVFISHTNHDVPIEGYRLAPIGATNDDNAVDIPIMRNVTIYAQATGGTADIRMIIY